MEKSNQNSKFIIPIAIAFMVVIVVLVFTLLSSRMNDSINNNINQSANDDIVEMEEDEEVLSFPTVPTSNNLDTTFTRQEVEQANTYENCMVIYSNDVYKVPSWFIDEHEGGSSEILDFCGKDLTEAFDENIDHTTDSYDQLKEFYVGKLV